MPSVAARDEVIYLDVDIVLFQDLRPLLLGRLRPGETDFIVVSRTNEYVYNERRLDYDYLRDAFLFNDGFFITSNKILSVQDFYDAMEVDEPVFDAVRQRGGLYAQPLCNFVVHRKRLKIVAVPDLIPGASNESYHKAQGVTFDADDTRRTDLAADLFRPLGRRDLHPDERRIRSCLESPVRSRQGPGRCGGPLAMTTGAA